MLSIGVSQAWVSGSGGTREGMPQWAAPRSSRVVRANGMPTERAAAVPGRRLRPRRSTVGWSPAASWSSRVVRPVAAGAFSASVPSSDDSAQRGIGGASLISWSKEPSRAIAAELASWLGGLVQAVEPWVSDEEIASGKRWRDEIGTALNDTDFGIICLTRANQHNPWLMFESGALAKHLTSARVIPLYIDLDAAEVTGPLADWQGRRLDHDGMWKVVHDINAATPKPVSKEALLRLFDRMWPDLEGGVAKAKEKAPEPEQPRRSADDMLEELVDRVRRLERQQRRPGIRVNPGDLVTLADGTSYRVPEDPGDLQKLEELRDLVAMRLYAASRPSPDAVHARGDIPTPRVSNWKATKLMDFENENPDATSQS